MKYGILVMVLSCLLARVSHGQAGEDALRQYRARLRTLPPVGYAVQRIDTFANGDVWNNRGRAVMQPSRTDTLFGGRFWASRSDVTETYFYDGHTGYALDDKARTLQPKASPYPPSVLGSPAGQMLVEELFAIDTTYQTVRYAATPQGNMLVLQYPDQPQRDILNRYTYLLLDPATGLPRQVRTVMQRGGGKWSTSKQLSEVRLGDPTDAALLEHPAFLTTYTRVVPAPRPTVATRVGRRAPDFQLANLTRGTVNLKSHLGKVVLLDFWETACSPCIASMPKVQHWQDQYKAQGLVVLGVLVEPSSTVARAQGILKRQQATYTNLLADEVIKAAYQVNIFPRYVLIDKAGNIAFDETGTSPQLEAAIRTALGVAAAK
jgi:peroxiredoxin